MPRIEPHRVLGVTIGQTVVAAAEAGAGSPAGAWSRTIEPLAAGQARWLALAAALRELRAARRPNGGAVSVALLPPLVEVRPIVLPPLTTDEARRVVARSTGRYFLGAREPQIIGIAPASAPNSTANGSRPVLAAAAALRLVEAVQAAVREAGFELRAIVPATMAWRTAAVAIWPELRRGSHAAVVLRAGGTELLEISDGVVTAVRRFGDAAADAAALREAIARPALARGVGAGGLAVLGPAALREALARTLDTAQVRILAPLGPRAPLAESPEVAAAAFATHDRQLELVSESTWRARRARRNRVAAVLSAIAAALLVVASGLELWGARRELEHVRRQRAALRPVIAALVATRDSAEAAERQLGELEVAARATHLWSQVLVTVSGALPRDAYLTAFRADRDSLVLEGLAKHAAGVFTAIDTMPTFAGVRSAGPVRRELGDRAATDVPEHFSVGARLTPMEQTDRLALGAPAGRP